MKEGFNKMPKIQQRIFVRQQVGKYLFPFGVLLELDGSNKSMYVSDFEKQQRPDDIFINFNTSMELLQAVLNPQALQPAQPAQRAPQDPQVVKLEISVETPKPTRELQKVKRSSGTGLIESTETKIEYT
jgi:hypothetical protein